MNDRGIFVVISPVRNEADFLRKTIAAMVNQSTRPKWWVIVDDGSNDDTYSIARTSANNHPWILALTRPDRGYRQPGTGVVDAFLEGYKTLPETNWDFLVKLDGDLDFPASTFELCLDHFYKDAHLGIGGGTVCSLKAGILVNEAPGDPQFHVRGAMKIYRRECWNQIGGLYAAPGWDTIDEYHANMLGWHTYTFPDIRMHHLRPAGGAQGTWKNWVKNGTANYIAGYHPLFMACKCLTRLPSRPYVVSAIGLLSGYLLACLKRTPQVPNPKLLHYVKTQQMNRLLLKSSLWDKKGSSDLSVGRFRR